jgi:acetyl esterase/lipase
VSARPRPRGCRRLFLRACLLLAAVLALGGLGVGLIWWYLYPACERSGPIVYGERGGEALTLERVRPTRPNGAGVLLLMSGGWKSKPSAFSPWIAAPLLRRGYTVIAVSHRSQPGASVQETVADLHRAVRFVRHHAAEYGIDPARLGVVGASSGGHLSLMLATRGGPGDSEAEDPLERESSAVQAVAIFFPLTNFLDLGSSTENAGDGGPPKNYRRAFGEEGLDPERWPALARELSPVFLAHAGQPPILVVHGDADTLTPLEQSEWFVEATEKAGGPPVELIVHKGRGHGWISLPLDLRRFAIWFDRHLAARP